MECKSLLVGPDYAEGLISKMKKVIRRSPHPGHAAQTRPPTASLGQRLQRAPAGTPRLKPSGLHSPPNGIASSLLANRPSLLLIIIALIAAMAVSLWLLLPGGPLAWAHDEPDADHVLVDHEHFPENSTDPVRKFVSEDPEGDTIHWSIRGLDADDFTINSSTGVLEFIDAPDYESPTDRMLDLNDNGNGNDGDTTVDLDGDGETDVTLSEYVGVDNDYQITVSATEMSGAMPQKRTDLDFTITVRNEEEKGTISLSALRPEVGTNITATLTDPDDGIDLTTGTDAGWTWSTSKVANPDLHTDSHWNDIADNLVTSTGAGLEANQSQYEPRGKRVVVIGDAAGNVPIDEDRYLRVIANYTDAQGTPKEAFGMSMLAVRAEVSNQLEHTALTTWDNGSPDFQADVAERTVSEDAAVGTPVGAIFQAIEPDPEDELTYSLDVVADTDEARADVALFSIDTLDNNGDMAPGMGQIKVKSKLDHEESGGTYMVNVVATDPSGEFDQITVTITVTDVNEPPVVTGLAELRVIEGIADATEADGLDYTVLVETPVANDHRYSVTELDDRDSIVSWRLEGPDWNLFDLSGPSGFEPRRLNFKRGDEPDYENPADMNQDNVYEVTIVAADKGTNRGTKNVTIEVLNTNEEGELVFTSGADAELGKEIVAEVQDPDDHGGDLGEDYEGVLIQTWQWSRAATDIAGTDFTLIPDATTGSYTPTAGDVGYYLRAQATYIEYTDDPRFPLSDADITTTPNIDERVTTTGTPPSLRTVTMTTEQAVREEVGDASVPTFGTQTIDRYMDETVYQETRRGENVGGPIEATIGETAVLKYSLEGTHADYFGIDENTGQITVGGDNNPAFDYDDNTEPSPYRLSVVVQVDGGDTRQRDEVRVNVNLNPIDEDLIIKHMEEQDAVVPAVDSRTSPTDLYTIEYPERNTAGDPNEDVVATFVGEDPEGSNIHWDLRGADAALFEISGNGELTFKAPPDFEEPGDQAAGADYVLTTPYAAVASSGVGDNNYEIVVRAIEDQHRGQTWVVQTLDRHVRVEVINSNDPGVVTLQWLQPEIGVPISATITDQDGIIGQIDWTWSVTRVANFANPDSTNEDHWREGQGTTSGETAVTTFYTPTEATPPATDADSDRYLRATVEYTDAYTETLSDSAARDDALGRTANTVQEALEGQNTGSPEFQEDVTTRSIPETTGVGGRVGSAVVVDVDHGDILTYGLRAVTAEDIPSDSDVVFPGATEATEDLDHFDIDKASGQITLKQKLDFEGTRDGKYAIVVTVTDPSAGHADAPQGFTGTDSIVVGITATEVNERPVLDGRAELTVDEDSELFRPNTDATLPAASVNWYTFSDQDHGDGFHEWRLEGVDADLFELSETDGRLLLFKAAPDYENPGDRDGDNVYKVRVVADDQVTRPAVRLAGGIDVAIEVRNVEEAGTVKLYDANDAEVVQPEAGTTIRAEVTDPDGGERQRQELVYQENRQLVTWVWEMNPNPPDTTNAAWDQIVHMVGGVEVPVSTASTFALTPALRGQFIRATATYEDNPPEGDEVQTPEETESGLDDLLARTAMSTTPHAVLVVDMHQAPVFADDSITRYVAENSASGTYVGMPVEAAVDPDGGMPAYEIMPGGDADKFELIAVNEDGTEPEQIVGSGSTDADRVLRQIRVKPAAPAADGVDAVPVLALNHGGEESSYTVTVRATDGTGLSDTVTVTIMVSDRNEAPGTPTEAPPGASIVGDSNPDVVEDVDGSGNREVTTYRVIDTDETAAWSLTGDDRADFNLGSSDGVLSFRNMPDYENPADNGGDNTYEITVNARVGTETLTLDVMVKVRNEDEDGEVTIDGPSAPGVGSTLTATVSDPDGGVTSESWQWARENSTTGNYDNIGGATFDTYTAVKDDVGSRLQAMVRYTDAQGSGKSAAAISSNAVTAEADDVGTGDPLVDSYDANDSGTIDRAEVGQAIRDFIGRQIEEDDVLEVIAQYFKDLRSGS